VKNRKFKGVVFGKLLVSFCFLVLLIWASVNVVEEANAENIVTKLKRNLFLTAEKILGYDLSLKEAMYYKKLASGEVQCTLCPLNCVIPEGKRGKCRVRVNIGGKLRAITYGKPIVVYMEPPEKEIFFHCLPGACSFVVATVGCNIECLWCQNWSISQTLPENETHQNLSPQELVKLTMDNGCRSVAFSYSEPTVFYEYMYETAQIAKQAGLKVLLKTNGFINPEPLKELLKYLDVVNIDLKGFTEKTYRKFCGGNLQPVLETAKITKNAGVWVEITYIIVPTVSDDPIEIRNALKWIIDNLGPETPIYFTRFIPNYKFTDKPQTPYEVLKSAHDEAVAMGFKYVYIVIVPGNPYEDTYCPQCKRKIVDREGFFIKEYHIKDGKCEYCGAKIDGVYK
jgi:pyruvate formate lyase activating enzyme